MVLLREIDFAGVIFSTAFICSVLCCLQCASLLHLPALMDPKPLQHFPFAIRFVFHGRWEQMHIVTSPDTMVEEKMGPQCCIYPLL